MRSRCSTNSMSRNKLLYVAYTSNAPNHLRILRDQVLARNSPLCSTGVSPVLMDSLPLRIGRTTWFLRKASALSLEHRLVCHVALFGNAFWFVTPRTPPLWQRGFFLVKCLSVATLVGFGEKRCRKNR